MKKEVPLDTGGLIPLLSNANVQLASQADLLLLLGQNRGCAWALEDKADK